MNNYEVGAENVTTMEDANAAAKAMYEQMLAAEQHTTDTNGQSGGEVSSPQAEGTQDQTPGQTKEPQQASEPTQQQKPQTSQDLPREIENLKRQLSDAQSIIREMQSANSAANRDIMETPTELNDDDFLANFYEKPVDTIRKIFKSAIQSEMGDIRHNYEQQQAQSQWAEAISNIAEKYEDFSDMQQDIAQVINNNQYLRNLDKQTAIENAYFLAKGMKKSNAPTIEQQLSDEGMLEQILKNPEIAKKIAIIQSRQQSQAGDFPPLSSSTGMVNATPQVYSSPISMDEADVIARKQLGLI